MAAAPPRPAPQGRAPCLSIKSPHAIAGGARRTQDASTDGIAPRRSRDRGSTPGLLVARPTIRTCPYSSSTRPSAVVPASISSIPRRTLCSSPSRAPSLRRAHLYSCCSSALRRLAASRPCARSTRLRRPRSPTARSASRGVTSRRSASPRARGRRRPSSARASPVASVLRPCPALTPVRLTASRLLQRSASSASPRACLLLRTAWRS
jgi:hypothetical protein